MSDTDRPPSTKRGLCLKVLAVLGLIAGLAVLHVVRIARATDASALPFEPFRWRPLERSLLEGKFDFLEGAGRLLDRSAEVTLDERELNAMLFGDKAQTPEHKARVLLQGERVVIESSEVQPDGRWKNIRVDVDAALGPGGLLKLDLVDGQTADHHLDPVLRAIAQWALRRAVSEEVAGNPRLRRVNAAYVKEGRLKIVYEP